VQPRPRRGLSLLCLTVSPRAFALYGLGVWCRGQRMSIDSCAHFEKQAVSGSTVAATRRDPPIVSNVAQGDRWREA
jgi:hypothetical protein